MTSCYWYAIFTSFGKPVDHQQMREQRLELYELPDYKPRIGRQNNYGYDIAEQKTQTFTGMGFDINVHDQWAIESQGRIQDRTREHLGYSDKAIIAYRRLLLSAIGQVGRGEKPPMWLDAGAGRHHSRAGDRRRHGPDRGLGGLLEGIRRPRRAQQRVRAGPANDALGLTGGATARMDSSASNAPVCGRTNAGRRRARPSAASRPARCRSCAWPSPTSTACCAARPLPRARSPPR